MSDVFEGLEHILEKIMIKVNYQRNLFYKIH